MSRRRLQFVWWWLSWENWGKPVRFRRMSGSWAFIYRWSFTVGPLEIRRWSRRPRTQEAAS